MSLRLVPPVEPAPVYTFTTSEHADLRADRDRQARYAERYHDHVYDAYQRGLLNQWPPYLRESLLRLMSDYALNTEHS